MISLSLLIGACLWAVFAGHVLAAETTQQQPRNAGTGFFVSAEGHFISANHAIGSCRHPAVLTPEGLLPAAHISASKEKDVALIKTDRRPSSFGRFAANPMSASQHPLTVVRYRHDGGLGSRNTTAARFFSSIPSRDGAFAVETKQAIASGNSGAPIVSRDGAIVGMLVARAAQRPRIGIATDAFTLSEFLSHVGVEVETISENEDNPSAINTARAHLFTFPVVCAASKTDAGTRPAPEQ
jgi:S1-C subfamily serine protease